MDQQNWFYILIILLVIFFVTNQQEETYTDWETKIHQFKAAILAEAKSKLAKPDPRINEPKRQEAQKEVDTAIIKAKSEYQSMIDGRKAEENRWEQEMIQAKQDAEVAETEAEKTKHLIKSAQAQENMYDAHRTSVTGCNLL